MAYLSLEDTKKRKTASQRLVQLRIHRDEALREAETSGNSMEREIALSMFFMWAGHIRGYREALKDLFGE